MTMSDDDEDMSDDDEDMSDDDLDDGGGGGGDKSIVAEGVKKWPRGRSYSRWKKAELMAFLAAHKGYAMDEMEPYTVSELQPWRCEHGLPVARMESRVAKNVARKAAKKAATAAKNVAKKAAKRAAKSAM